MAALQQKLEAHQRTLATLACIIVLGLVAQNLYWLARNQRELPQKRRFAITSRRIDRIASADPHSKVRGRIAVFYHIRKRLLGKELVVPSSWASERWFLERVARVNVIQSEQELAVSAKRARKALHGQPATVSWHVRTRQARGRYQPLYLLRDGNAGRYVLAPGDNGRGVFVLPERVFRRVQSVRTEGAP